MKLVENVRVKESERERKRERCMPFFPVMHEGMTSGLHHTHTPTDTHIFAQNMHAPGWAGHWCMYTPDMLSTCTSVTYAHHSTLSPPPAHLLLLPSTCLLLLYWNRHMLPSLQLSRKNLLGVEHMSKTQQSEQHRSTRKETFFCYIQAADTWHARERMENTSRWWYMTALMCCSIPVDSLHTCCDSFCHWSTTHRSTFILF